MSAEDKKDEKVAAANFIRPIIQEDNKTGKWGGKVVTRFPPEPNGWPHIGHSKAIFVNYSLTQEFGGTFHLRFDDTNPEKEDMEYVEAIKRDVKWLGAEWGDKLFFASDYYDKLYDFAVQLIKDGKAFVCELNVDQMREYRGTLTEPGKNSPWRDRPIEENLDLFSRMRAGEFEDGKMSLRAKIDMSSPNINMRDPVIYRIKRHHHYRTGDKWCIYPMYDYTHPISDSLEGITHSLCSLEFEDHRPLYDWTCRELGIHHPQQIEFARLNLEYTVTSKRYLRQLVEDKHVNGWDDPRMPTISGIRRRGYTPKSLWKFNEAVGVTKKNSSIAMSTLEAHVRDDLNEICPRAFAVLDPLKVTITNWPAGKVQEIEVENHPFNESYGKRKITFSNELYIEQDDFMEEAPKKFFRLKPGGDVRLKFAYVLTCDEVVKDSSGKVTELKCTYHEGTFGGVTPEGMKKVKGIINWVDAKTAVDAEVRLYDRLFKVPQVKKDLSLEEQLNENNLEVVTAKVEASLANSKVDDKFQFERQGYFRRDEDPGLIFNRTVTLKDTWWKIEQAHAENN